MGTIAIALCGAVPGMAIQFTAAQRSVTALLRPAATISSVFGWCVFPPGLNISLHFVTFALFSNFLFSAFARSALKNFF